MFHSIVLVSLLFTRFILADSSVDVTTTVTQSNPNTYCVSGVCLSINSAPSQVTQGTGTQTSTETGDWGTSTTTSTGGITTTTSTSTTPTGTMTSTTSGGITTTTGTEHKPSKPSKHNKPTKAPKGTSSPVGNNPTQPPSSPGTVVVQKAPTCDVCQAGVFVFYLQPSCCPDGSVCDIAGFLSSGPLELPSDCGATGTAAITFDACKCQFYCNNTLGQGGNPTLSPTYPPTTVAPTTEAPTTEAPTTEAPTTEAPTTEAPTTEAPTTEAPTTAAPTTAAPTTAAPTTEAPTTQAPTTPAPTAAPTTPAPTTAAPTTPTPTTQAPTTAAPTTKTPTLAPTTKAPTTKAPTTMAPTTLAPTIPNHGGNPTQTPTTAPSSCNRCNATHIFFVVFPVCCSNQLISLCNNTQIANAAKHLPDNCNQDSITWDGCSCSFYCNTTSATIPVNPNQPSGGAPVLPVPQTEIQTDTVDIHFNITTHNNTHCIAGTSICITINGASQNAQSMFMFPLMISLIMGVFSFL